MSDCSCIWVDDYEHPEFHSSKMVTARKQHICSECHRIIERGERYEKVVGKWSGDLSTYKTCIDCLSVREAFFCESWMYTMIWDYLWDHICDREGEIESDCIVSLTSSSREKVCDMIEEVWKDLNDIDEEFKELNF